MKHYDRSNFILGHAREVAYVGLFVALITVTAYLSIPSTIPFTLQSFGVFLSLAVLGGKRGTISTCCYVAMGALGLPVFAGMKGGASVLFGATGGYIFGFLLGSTVFWLAEIVFKKSFLTTVLSIVLACLIYLACGAFWYAIVYLGSFSKENVYLAISTCILPFIIPEIVKISLATLLARKLKTKICF